MAALQCSMSALSLSSSSFFGQRLFPPVSLSSPQIEGPILSSNVMLYSKEQNVASCAGHKILEDGTRVRHLLKTGENIDSAENRKRGIKERSKKTEEAVAAS